MNSKSSPNNVAITVLGGGNGACATAAHLALSGFQVTLCELPEFAETAAPMRQAGGIELRRAGLPELPAGFAHFDVTTEPAKALAESTIVWAPIPAYAQGHFAAACAPYLRPDQIVVLAPGNFGGAIEFAGVLQRYGVRSLPKIAEAETMIYAARKESPTAIRAFGFKHSLGVAAFPAADTAAILPVLRQCYPDLTDAGSVLDTALRNPNLVVHAPILLLNTGWLETPASSFLFYHHGCTPSVGKIIDAIDRERVAVGAALGLQLPSLYELELRWYGHQGAAGATLPEVMRTNPAYAGIAAPKTVNYRYLTEDVPYGMVPLETLGVFVGMPTPITSAIVNLAGEVLGVDFRAKARDLKSLGLDKLTLPELKDYVQQRRP